MLQKMIAPIICLLASMLSAPGQVAAMNFSKTVPHYAQDMEYFYQKPRPEIVPQILANFSDNGILDKSENRLMLGAFLAELAKTGKLNPEQLIRKNRHSSRAVRHTLAWCLHLAGAKNGPALLDQILDGNDAVLRAQISRSPHRLEDWQIKPEKAVVQMYWAAFMATGDSKWVDILLDIALETVDASGRPRHHSVGELAAATLFDYAQRHPVVKRRIAERIKMAHGNGKKLLDRILASEK